MSITIGGVDFPNGASLSIGGVQAQRVTVNGTEVWVNNYVSDAPTAFTASNTSTATINFAWTLPLDQGVPVCTYSIRNASNTEVATAGAGVTTASYVTTVSTSENFTVVAINVAGEAVSNADNGSSYVGAASPLIIGGDTTVIAGVDFPASVPVTICMCGGGAGGSQVTAAAEATAGGAGQVISGERTYALNEAVTVNIGAPTTGTASGNSSSFGGMTASGGSTGQRPASNGSVTTCGGTGTNGYHLLQGGSYDAYGGASSGFGNGGGGQAYATSGGNGGIGSGGGGSSNAQYPAAVGIGGRGQVNVSW